VKILELFYQVQNTSKQAYSVMFCGSAAGTMLAPMIVYKAENLYPSWIKRAPKGTKFSVSPNGWFGAFQFEQFFFELALPYLRRKEGKRMMIGDNLSSHISPDVIQACKDNDIQFVCLPPHSTDKLQPLDVGVFGPVKKAWRKILDDFKVKHPKEAGIQKSDFPPLLKQLLEEVQPGKYLPAAFERCGLFPVDITKAVERIPHRSMETNSETIKEILSSSLGEKLDQLRGTDKKKITKRGKKIKVPAGKSYTEVREEMEEMEREMEELEEEEEEEETFAGKGKSRGKNAGKGKRKKPVHISSDEELSDLDLEEDDDEDEEGDDVEPDMEQDDKEEDEMEQEKEKKLTVGTFVAAVYEKSWYLAQVEGEEEEEEGFTLLKYMERKGYNKFVWGDKDILRTRDSDILMEVDPPLPTNSRFYGLPKEALKKVDTLFMVKWSIILIHFYSKSLKELVKFGLTWVKFV